MKDIIIKGFLIEKAFTISKFFLNLVRAPLISFFPVTSWDSPLGSCKTSVQRMIVGFVVTTRVIVAFKSLLIRVIVGS